MPIVSVIVPVYKVEAYLCYCVDSILYQTFSDFELILVDDGSPDRCPSICDEYAKRDSRVKVIHQHNQGQAAARNHGVQMATGEWIMFVDSDDYIHPQLLEYLYHGVQHQNVKLSAASVQRVDVDYENVGERIDNVTFDDYIIDNENVLLEVSQLPAVYWLPFCKLIHVSVVRKHPFPLGRIYEDNAVVYKWIDSASYIRVTQTSLYFYRRNVEGTNLGAFSTKKLDYLLALEEQIEFYNKKRYFKMIAKICDDYLQVATDYYLKIKNELKDVKMAKKVRSKVIRVFFKNRRHVTLPLHAVSYCAEQLQSKSMRYWVMRKDYFSRFKNLK